MASPYSIAAMLIADEAHLSAAARLSFRFLIVISRTIALSLPSCWSRGSRSLATRATPPGLTRLSRMNSKLVTWRSVVWRYPQKASLFCFSPSILTAPCSRRDSTIRRNFERLVGYSLSLCAIHHRYAACGFIPLPTSTVNLLRISVVSGNAGKLRPSTLSVSRGWALDKREGTCRVNVRSPSTCTLTAMRDRVASSPVTRGSNLTEIDSRSCMVPGGTSPSVKVQTSASTWFRYSP
mmetsp:Transcript_70176/g.182941  ORF Transcript_70176/g.182941 Transcript_70176/m.182941 type:complete len:237 (+) Transcript_70176:385-1095(+)